MNYRKRIRKTQIISLIISGAIFLGFLIGFLILFFSENNQKQALFLVFSLLLPISLAVLIIVIIWHQYTENLFKISFRDNKYLLGDETNIFNFLIYEERNKFLDRLHKKDPKYVIAFSPASYITSSNIYKNSIIKELNKEVSLIIEKSMYEDHFFTSKECSFCYYEKLFIISVYCDQTKVDGYMEYLKQKLYDVVLEKNLKVLASPYFGIAEAKGKELMDATLNAMYARRYAENNFQEACLYDISLRKEATLEEIDEMKKALANGEFEVYYQPRYSLKEKRFVSAEALIRWNSPKYGMLQPAKFIDKAESGGILHELDSFVFNTVCKKLHDDRNSNKRFIPVTINFSLYEFYNPGFVMNIFNTLENNKLAPELIEIGINETTTQANTFLASTIINKLKKFGLKVVMNGFGSGYSSISALNKLPFDVIKIDKSIIDGIIQNNKSLETVKLIEGFCRANNITVIAEGVDSEKEINLLSKNTKCDIIQGFYYSQPLTSADYDKFLIKNNFEAKGGKTLWF